jgi:hypothetical protein
MERLEDEADLVPTDRGQAPLVQPVDALPVKRDLARVRTVGTAEQVQQRGFSRARPPHDGDELAAPDVEIRAVEDAALSVTLAEGLRENRVRGRASTPRCPG